MTDPPILLSPPHLGDREREYLLAALDANWVAPAGPDLALFEHAAAVATGRDFGVAVSSGTAALHLILHALGIGAGDVVLVPTLTFAATLNAVLYTGAQPVLVDSDPQSWTIDPALVAQALHQHRARAVLPVDLYGQCADYDALDAVCDASGAVLVSDAAESLGATYRDRPAGARGVAAALSFNGNKIITTGGGGMVVTDDEHLADRIRTLSTQARQPVRHYEHVEVGFNYRLSNLLAAVGRGQVEVLGDRVAARRRTNALYRELLGTTEGVTFMPAAAYGEPNWWLTALLIDPRLFGATRDDVCDHLASKGIEARPTWKPMHLQPAYQGLPVVGGAHAEHVWEQGICLPSGSALTRADVERVASTLLSTPRPAFATR